MLEQDSCLLSKCVKAGIEIIFVPSAHIKVLRWAVAMQLLHGFLGTFCFLQCRFNFVERLWFVGCDFFIINYNNNI